ncbi:cyclic pyranopterin monophosphate synthase MoaC [Fulvivirgaceae bacterium BMA12]|uniref:Cyclic pyranopterin monophosphate synthase n=1 Tax=Agaribacillus aureus TaxID=3051825 RepID=A0ABT8LH81_9BACT|nr:cyclic pyranopterin monophosphate synthase MoaC [Fulvivirgaceae bacterium BMA12]
MKDSQEDRFSHLDEQGNPNMVDVSDKAASKRTATARAIVVLPNEILAQFEKEEIQTKKGPVFQTAVLAGIMAAKKTGDLIPLCHPLPLENCNVTIRLNKDNEVEINATATITHKTGVEMEALTAVSVAALTIYDMCKALSHHIVIKDIRLIEKTGGKKDFKYQ